MDEIVWKSDKYTLKHIHKNNVEYSQIDTKKPEMNQMVFWQKSVA